MERYSKTVESRQKERERQTDRERETDRQRKINKKVPEM
jgi:hypothetical protein